jgi:hypothetical protein
MPQHLYTREQGYEILAGQDCTDKRYKTTRYMLLYNRTLEKNRAAILTAGGYGKERTNWKLMAEGKAYDMSQLFDKLDAGLV